EERGEDADEDDRRDHAAAQDLVARDGRGREVAARHPAIDEARDDKGHDQDPAEHGQPMPPGHFSVPLVEWQRFPAREAFVDAIPVGVFAPADRPAEEPLLPAAERGKVDESAVEVLHEHTQGLELLDAAGDGLALALEPFLDRARLLRIEVAAVARDSLDE